MSSINDESIWITDIKEGYEYLKDTSNFYSFAEGLTVLITKYGYDGQIEDTVSKTNFIISKLQSVDVSITKSTIKDWFDNKRRPLSGSRNVIFQICFALSVSFEDIKDFLAVSILKEVLTAILPKKLYIIIVLKESLHITMQNSWLILLILFLYIKINHQMFLQKK